MDKGSLCKSCKHGSTPMSAQTCSMCWNTAGDMFEPKEEAGKKDTLASDEVIRGMVEALYNLTARASYFGYGFSLGHEMAEAEQALAQARKHLQSEK